jgi:hypothetical protein
MRLPVAVIVFMSGRLQYVAVRRLGRSPWSFSLAYALPFLFWTLLFVGEVVPLTIWVSTHDAGPYRVRVRRIPVGAAVTW